MVIYQTKTLFSRVCVPTDDIFYKSIKSLVHPETVQQWWSDMDSAKWVIISMMIFALVVAFVWMYAVKYCAGNIVWCCIITYFVILIAGTFWLYNKKTEAE